MAQLYISSAATNDYDIGLITNDGTSKTNDGGNVGPFLGFNEVNGLSGTNTVLVNGIEVNIDTATIQGAPGSIVTYTAEVPGATTIRATTSVARLFNAAGGDGTIVFTNKFKFHTDNVTAGMIYGQGGTNACTVTVIDAEVIGTAAIPIEGFVYAGTITGGAPVLTVTNLTVSANITRSLVQSPAGACAIAIDGINFNNVTCAATGNTVIGCNEADAGATFSATGLTGDINFTGVSGAVGFCRTFDIDAATMNVNSDLNITVDNTALVVEMFRQSRKTLSCDNGQINNNVNCNLIAVAGYNVLFGEDSGVESQLDINNCQAIGNTFNNITPAGTTTIHSLMAGRVVGVTFDNNNVTGTQHAVIYKQSSGSADNNTAAQVRPLGDAFRAKGANDVTFSNGKLISTVGWEGTMERTDNNGGTACSNVLFLTNNLTIKSGSDYSSASYTDQAIGYTITEAEWNGSNYFDESGPLGSRFSSDTGFVGFDTWSAKAYVSNVTNIDTSGPPIPRTPNFLEAPLFTFTSV